MHFEQSVAWEYPQYIPLQKRYVFLFLISQIMKSKIIKNIILTYIITKNFIRIMVRAITSKHIKRIFIKNKRMFSSIRKISRKFFPSFGHLNKILLKIDTTFLITIPVLYSNKSFFTQLI